MDDHLNPRPVEPNGPTDEFVDLVRQALANLYDFRFLQDHTLRLYLLGTEGAEQAGNASNTVRRKLLDALETLNPGRDVYFRSQQARTHSLLHMHFVEGIPLNEVATDLGISLRQAQRDLKRGVEIMAAYLWSLRPRPSAAGPRAAELSSLDTEVGRLGSQTEPMDVERLAHRGIESVGRLAAQRNIVFELRSNEDNLVVTSNPTLAQQVLTSLFSSVAQQLSDCSIRVDIARKGAQLTITLACPDVGSTFEPAPLPELATRLAGREGWSLAQALSTDGTFVVELAILSHRSTLLVIDDNEGLVQLLVRYLAGYSVLVLPAYNGHQGIQIAKEVPLDGILVDVMMPGMDGWEVVQRLRALPQTATIPVIVCSVFNDPELAISLGATALLPKPVRRDDVLNSLVTHGVLAAATDR